MVTLTNAQLSMLLEGIDWRIPGWTARPKVIARKSGGDPGSTVVPACGHWYSAPMDDALSTLEEENAMLRRQLAERPDHASAAHPSRAAF
jgi:transposase